MFRLHQRRRGLHGYGSSTALVTANESVCVLHLCQARWPRASLQPHVSRRRVFLTEQLNRRFLAFPIQPLSRLRAERTQQIHNVSVYYKRGQLLVTRVEQTLSVSNPVAHSQDAVQTWLELATISAICDSRPTTASIALRLIRFASSSPRSDFLMTGLRTGEASSSSQCASPFQLSHITQS